MECFVPNQTVHLPNDLSLTLQNTLQLPLRCALQQENMSPECLQTVCKSDCMQKVCRTQELLEMIFSCLNPSAVKNASLVSRLVSKNCILNVLNIVLQTLEVRDW